MACVYIVTGLDYRYEKSEKVDERDMTHFICRVFAKLEDAEKYMTNFFNQWATEDSVFELRKTKNGFINAELKDKSKDGDSIYANVFRLTTQEVTEELGKNDLSDDMHNPFCD